MGVFFYLTKILCSNHYGDDTGETEMTAQIADMCSQQKVIISFNILKGDMDSLVHLVSGHMSIFR